MGKIVLLLVALSCIVHAQGTWQLVGFENINVKCIAQDWQDTLNMLIAYADSIYRSSDGGTSWSFAADFAGLPVNYLFYDPFDIDTVYAAVGQGTYSDGIYRSTNGGYEWEVLEWIYIPTCIVIPGWPVDLIVVGSNGSGVFKSEDNGAAWQVWNDGLGDLHVHSLGYSCPTESFPVFSAGTESGLFIKPYNGWIQAPGIPTDLRVSDIAYQSSGVGFATVTGGSWSDGIYVSSNYGISWQISDYWIYPSCIVVNPPWDSGHVFAGDSGLGIKHSSDMGTTWQELNAGLGNLYINMFSYCYLDTARLFCATQSGLYRFHSEPGIVEQEILDYAIFKIPLSILHAEQPIPIVYQDQGKKYSLDIIDPAGRKIRTDLITQSTTTLPGLKRPGVYFIVLQDQGNYCTKKIIVVD